MMSGLMDLPRDMLVEILTPLNVRSLRSFLRAGKACNELKHDAELRVRRMFLHRRGDVLKRAVATPGILDRVLRCLEEEDPHGVPPYVPLVEAVDRAPPLTDDQLTRLLRLLARESPEAARMKGYQALCRACKLGDEHVVVDVLLADDFVRAAALADASRPSPLGIACGSDRTGLALRLLEDGPDRDAWLDASPYSPGFWKRPLDCACRNGNATLVARLLELGAAAHAGDDGYNALHSVCRGRGGIVCLDAVLRSLPDGWLRAHINDQSQMHRRTALHYLARSGGPVSIARRLVALGADPNVRDREARRPCTTPAKKTVGGEDRETLLAFLRTVTRDEPWPPLCSDDGEDQI